MIAIVTGGTGMIGKAVVSRLLESGYQVVIFTRKKQLHGRVQGALSYRYWNVETGEIDRNAVLTADYIIHLAGAGVMERPWSATYKKVIVDSRVQSGLLLSDTLLSGVNRLKALVSASAIGWYGPDPEIPNPAPFTEDRPAAPGFLGHCCMQWEQSTASLERRGIRVAYLRTGVVLAPGGGALSMILQPLKWRIAAVPGNGRQVISWIHIHDLVSLYLAALEEESYRGACNAAAPAPVSNATLVRSLAEHRYGNAFISIPIPAALLRLVLGERAAEVLGSTTVSARKVQVKGFVFQYPDIGSAIRQLLK
ncbi:TIGR01777 family oxidoreductase [Niabella aurantiaca]|uniref:TIGR01777 family oxidoreductase n=1 Tax=Niabella aurantiaca TaxID=379900 RepID=UPI00036358D1|nr:TIGR01777 family oxidoreductase [Niabella aurantiaca]